jgi:predicted esterase
MPVTQRAIARWLFLLVTLLMIQHLAIAQTQTPFKIESVGEEAFRVILQFFQYDKGIPLEARVVDRQDNSDYVREKIVFRGVRDSRVPGYLAIPKTGEASYPCVLQIHGLNGSKSTFWDDEKGGPLTKELLEAGFAVLSLDAQYHGERMSSNDYESPGKMFKRGWSNKTREMVIQSTVEYRRALDYLETRTEIDNTRIGIIGYSMGGIMTFCLTGVEPRIKVSVACVTPPFKDRFSPWAPQNFARAVSGRPYLMLMGRKDQVYTEEQAQQLYELIESPTKELFFYDSGHRLPPDHTKKALEWFQAYLK